MFTRYLRTNNIRGIARQFSTPTLSAETIRIVKATAPVMAEHGYTITRTMYGKMLTENSDVKAMFNPTHQVELPGEKKARQPATLAAAIHAYAANIDNLGALSAAVETIAQKHVSVHVLPEHYITVKNNLLWAVGQVLGPALTPEIGKAWSEAYDFLAWIFIEREKQLREGKAAAKGGWEGYRPFKVVDIKQEGKEIKSFILRPADGKSIITYEPGSYVGVQVNTPTGKTVRNYSMSYPPDKDSYRISVKQMDPLVPGAPKGSVSNMLHSSLKIGDQLSIGVPCGDFVLRVNDKKPIVLISGGVGITPIVSMFEYIVEKNIANNVVMVNASRNPEVEPMKEEIEKFAKRKSNAAVHKIYDPKQGPMYSEEELMSKLDKFIPTKDANYYFCGPIPFMQKIHAGLMKWNIPKTQIHYEYFGPTGNL